MKKNTFIAVTASASLFALTGSLSAAPVTLNGLTFSEQTGDFSITDGSGSGSENDPFVIEETVTGFDVTMSIEGLQSNFSGCEVAGFTACFFLTKEVTNASGETWNFYDHELQEELGTASSEGDGLSFAQGLTSVRPYTSDVFDSVDEETQERDYINFFDGSVADGETVSFAYWISDNSPEDEFFLRQRPNFSTTSTVPEPATIFLFGLGLLGISAVSRLRNKSHDA